MITIKIIPNLLKIGHREEIQMEWRADLPLSAYIPPAYQSERYRAVLSMRGVVPFERWNDVFPKAGEEIIITPEIHGSILAGAGLLAAILISTAVQLAVQVTMQALFPAAEMTPNFGGDGDASSSPTYGWNGIQNTSDVDVPVPVIYGQHRTGGNYINAYLTSEDNNHYLNVLLALCEGPVQSIAGITEDTDYADVDDIGDKILIDGNPISNYDECEVFVRLGSETQTVIPGFQELHDLQEHRNQLQKGSAQTYRTVNTDVEFIRLFFEMPSLFTVSDKGKYKQYEVKAKIEYRAVGAAEWTVSEEFSYKGMSTTVVRRSKRVPIPEAGEYDIRITKTSGNSAERRQSDLYLTGIDEIKYEDLAYPFTALLGLRVMATDQLSGSLNNVTVLVQGRTVDKYQGGMWVNQYSQNPIWCMYDLLMSSRYGLGRYMDSSHVDQALLLEMATYCNAQVDTDGDGTTENRFQLNMVIDSQQRALDLLSAMGATCRAMMVWSQGTVRFIIDKEASPSQMFTMGNIIRGSFLESWTSLRETYNVIEIQYMDAANDYTRETVQVVDEPSLAAGAYYRKKIMFLPGITSRTQAVRIGRYMLALGKYSKRSIQFKAAIDAIACQVGDRIDFAHDVPQWGVSSGRLTQGGTSIKCSMPVVLASGKSYILRVRHSADDTMEEYAITSAAGTYQPGAAIAITVGSGGPAPAADDVYAIGEANLTVKPFRIMQVSRASDGEVEISAIEYDVNIYDDSEDWALAVPVQYSNLPDPRRVPDNVENFTATPVNDYSFSVILGWTYPESTTVAGFIDHVRVYVSSDGGNHYDYAGESNTRQIVLKGLTPLKRLYFAGMAVSKWGVRRKLADCVFTNAYIKPTSLVPPDIRGLELKGRGKSTEFVGRDAVFTWKEVSLATGDLFNSVAGAGAGSNDTWFAGYRVEIWNEDESQRMRTETTRLNEYAYTYEKNYEDTNGVPARAFVIKVWAMDIFNTLSAIPGRLAVENPAPAAPAWATVQWIPGVDENDPARRLHFEWANLTESNLPTPDHTGYIIVRRDVSGVAGNWLVYGGPGITSYDLPMIGANWYSSYWFYVAAYDIFYKPVLHEWSPGRWLLDGYSKAELHWTECSEV